MNELLHALRDAWDNREERWNSFRQGVSEVPERFRNSDGGVRKTLALLVAVCFLIMLMSVI